jgi:hypothetical protein
MHLSVGHVEREQILSGTVKLSDSTFEKIIANSEGPIFKINTKRSVSIINRALEDALNVDGTLDIQAMTGEEKGEIIAHASKNGLIIHFDDYRGKYSWSKKNN